MHHSERNFISLLLPKLVEVNFSLKEERGGGREGGEGEREEEK
jgi:hypothetical protein